MIRILAALALIAAVAGGASLPADAAGDPSVCLKTCIDQYGADKKQACALQCGYGQNAGSSGGRDCGQVYKQCLQACATDKACKDACRKARTACH